MVPQKSQIESEYEKMSPFLRFALMISSILVALFILLRIRKKHLNIDDAMYWLFFSVLLLIVGIFPNIAIWASEQIGIESPSNFVFLVIIFLIVIKLFYVCIDLSIQKQRLNFLIQRLALLHKEMNDEEQNKITEVVKQVHAELTEAEQTESDTANESTN